MRTLPALPAQVTSTVLNIATAEVDREPPPPGPGNIYGMVRDPEDVAEPDGEVLVTVEAATACATDVKCLRYGHLILDPYPARFGHETAGVRVDTGERVLVGDSVACGACAPCLAGRAAICRAPCQIWRGPISPKCRCGERRDVPAILGRLRCAE